MEPYVQSLTHGANMSRNPSCHEKIFWDVCEETTEATIGA